MKVKDILAEHSMLEPFTYKEACDIAHKIATSRGEVADLHTVRIAYDEAVKACKHHGVDPLTHLHQYFVHFYNNGYPKDHGFDGHLGMHDSLKETNLTEARFRKGDTVKLNGVGPYKVSKVTGKNKKRYYLDDTNGKRIASGYEHEITPIARK